jgi:hypothetical protein
MLDTLAQACNDGGQLVGATCALFDGDPAFITAIALQFEHLSVVFRAVSDDDTLAASVGALAAEPEEEIADLSTQRPWSACRGLGVCWGWQLTNQQGYTDGVRLEFSAPGEASHTIVELVVIASGFQVFEVVAAKAGRTGRCT